MWHNIWVTLPKYINRSKSTQLIRFHFWCILCGNKHEPKSGILLCFCHSTSANYWHATAANVCLFHPVSEMGKWIHANPECRFSKKTGIYVKFVLCLTQGPFLTQLKLWFDIHYLNPVLLLRSFVVLFFFYFCQTLSWPGAGWAITLTTLAGLSDQLSKILLGPAWSKIGPANVGLKRQKFWLENDPSA